MGSELWEQFVKLWKYLTNLAGLVEFVPIDQAFACDISSGGDRIALAKFRVRRRGRRHFKNEFAVNDLIT